jgi:hypothetical protein
MKRKIPVSYKQNGISFFKAIAIVVQRLRKGNVFILIQWGLGVGTDTS